MKTTKKTEIEIDCDFKNPDVKITVAASDRDLRFRTQREGETDALVVMETEGSRVNFEMISHLNSGEISDNKNKIDNITSFRELPDLQHKPMSPAQGAV